MGEVLARSRLLRGVVQDVLQLLAQRVVQLQLLRRESGFWLRGVVANLNSFRAG